MQAHGLPARAGWEWIKQGIALFRRQPLGLMTLFMTFVFAILLLTMIPIAGLVLPAVLYPGLSLAFMVGCRDVVAGRRVLPTTLVAPFREHDGRAVRPLLVLGVLFLVALALAMLATALFDGGQLLRATVGFGQTAPDAFEQPDVVRAMIVAIVLQLAITFVFWYAPVLVAWHDVSPVKALFFSAVAAWRNLAPFVAYGVGLFVLVVLVQIVALTVLTLLGVPARFQLVLYSPLLVAVMTVVYCSVYASYRMTFDIRDDNVMRLSL
ncbi:MAG TPA: BPSS1780 family membrane protein [Burkholderiaceae bacterium]|nr:BPSS1780 family membrane protein [Burkholderiaceae bacterium]